MSRDHRRCRSCLRRAALAWLASWSVGAAAEIELPHTLHIGVVTIVSDVDARAEISGIEVRARPPALRVERTRIDLLGGRVTVEPVHIEAGEGETSTAVWIAGLELEAMAALLAIDGLSGEGLFDGQIPAMIGASLDAEITDGIVISRGGGVIRYRPPVPPAALAGHPGGVGLLMEALENFHYDRVAITLAGRLSEAMTVGLQLRGRNPDLYGGHPFELNVNLEGALGTLVRQAFEAYALPDMLAERVGDLFR